MRTRLPNVMHNETASTDPDDGARVAPLTSSLPSLGTDYIQGFMDRSIYDHAANRSSGTGCGPKLWAARLLRIASVTPLRQAHLFVDKWV